MRVSQLSSVTHTKQRRDTNPTSHDGAGNRVTWSTRAVRDARTLQRERPTSALVSHPGVWFCEGSGRGVVWGGVSHLVVAVGRSARSSLVLLSERSWCMPPKTQRSTVLVPSAGARVGQWGGGRRVDLSTLMTGGIWGGLSFRSAAENAGHHQP